MTAKSAAAALYREELRQVGQRWGIDPVVVRDPAYGGPRKFADIRRLITLAFLAGLYGEARRWAAYSYQDYLRIVREASNSVSGWPSARAVLDDSTRSGATALFCGLAPQMWMAASKGPPPAKELRLMREGIRFVGEARAKQFAFVKRSAPEEDDYPGDRIEAVRDLFEGMRLPALILDDRPALRKCESLRKAGRLNFRAKPGVRMDGAARLFALFDDAHSALDDRDPGLIGISHAALYDHLRKTIPKPYHFSFLFAELPLVLLGILSARGPVHYPSRSSLAIFSGRDYWAD